MDDRFICNCSFHPTSDILNIAQPSSHMLFWNSESSCPVVISTKFMMTMSTRNVNLNYCSMFCSQKEYLDVLNLKSATLFCLFWAKYRSPSNFIDWFRISWIFSTFDVNFLFWLCGYATTSINMPQQFFKKKTLFFSIILCSHWTPYYGVQLLSLHGLNGGVVECTTVCIEGPWAQWLSGLWSLCLRHPKDSNIR